MQLQEFPCPVEEKQALNRLLPLAKHNNTYTISQKCQVMEVVVRGIFFGSQTEMSFNSKMTVLTVLVKIIKSPFIRGDQFNIISEVINMSRKITYIRGCITYLEINLGLQGFSSYVYRIYISSLNDKARQIDSFHEMLSERIDALSIPIQLTHANRIPQNNLENVTFLKDEESLNRCPSLKHKLASSTDTLVNSSSDDICSVCLVSTISTQTNFAILDKCVHLFCKLCIGKWFQTA